MHVVFDLDGVVIDTEDVVARCYELAGATPPSSILAHENSDWLIRQCDGRHHIASAIKRRKNMFYLNSLRAGAVPWLAGAYAAAELHAEGHRVHLLSGAPSGTVSVVKDLWLDRFPRWPFALATDGMRTIDKMKMIRLIADRSSGNRGVYVDDQNKFIDLPVGWRFVHFIEPLRSVNSLLHEIAREEGTKT